MVAARGRPGGGREPKAPTPVRARRHLDKGATRPAGRTYATPFAQPSRTPNGAIFRDSRLDIMIHPADTAARVVHKHCRKNAHFRGWFEPIRAKFDANPAVVALKEGDGGA